MTLDNEIKRCEKVADDQDWLASSYDDGSMGKKLCTECAEEHRQLVHWLKELEVRRRVLDELEEAYREMDEWEFLEYCKVLWG